MDIMVDGETLGVKPGSVLLSWGAVAFDPLIRLGDRAKGHNFFYRNIDIMSCLTAGLKIEEDTVEWWRDQSAEAREAMREKQMTLFVAVKEFLAWATSVRELKASIDGTPLEKTELRFWAKGPIFDFGIFEAAARAVGEPVPWRYYEPRDVRTIKTGRELFDRAAATKLPPPPQAPAASPFAFPPQGIPPKAPTNDFAGIKHNALDDCYYQVKELQRAIGVI